MAKSQGMRGKRHWTSEAAEFQFRSMKEKKANVLVSQGCPPLWDPMDCSLPGSSVHGLLQVRILEWVAIPFSRGSSPPRARTQVAYTARRFFTTWTTRKALQTSCKRARAPSLLTGALAQVAASPPQPRAEELRPQHLLREGSYVCSSHSWVCLGGIRTEALFELRLYGKWEGWEKFQAGLWGERSEWFHSVYS